MAGTEVRVNEAGDILYLRLLPAPIALSREFGDLRCADYDGEGRLAGVELIGLPGGMSLRGLPEAARVREDLRAHGPPALRIEGATVFHPGGGDDVSSGSTAPDTGNAGLAASSANGTASRLALGLMALAATAGARFATGRAR